MIIGIGLLIVIGLGGGMVIAAAVAALISASGVAVRIIGESHTARQVKLYENMIVLGIIIANLFWIFEIEILSLGIANLILLILAGLFMGIFVGALAVSLSEALNATAIFSRRAKLRTGFQYIVLTIAISKTVGAFLQLIGDFI